MHALGPTKSMEFIIRIDFFVLYFYSVRNILYLQIDLESTVHVFLNRYSRFVILRRFGLEIFWSVLEYLQDWLQLAQYYKPLLVYFFLFFTVVYNQEQLILQKICVLDQSPTKQGNSFIKSLGCNQEPVLMVYVRYLESTMNKVVSGDKDEFACKPEN